MYSCTLAGWRTGYFGHWVLTSQIVEKVQQWRDARRGWILQSCHVSLMFRVSLPNSPTICLLQLFSLNHYHHHHRHNNTYCILFIILWRCLTIIYVIKWTIVAPTAVQRSEGRNKRLWCERFCFKKSNFTKNLKNLFIGWYGQRKRVERFQNIT